MTPYEGFKKRHYIQRKKWREFSSADISKFKKNLPEDIVGFLEIEGISSYSNNFLWTTHPDEFHDVLSSWGLKGEKRYAFIRTAFGACVYYYANEFFYLDPIEGRYASLGDNPYMVLNYFLVMDVILINAFFEDYFKSLKADPEILTPETIFAFVPAIPLGGSFQDSKVEAVQMKEHLFLLAQLFKNKAKLVE